MKIIAIVQARMGSTRFPNKVMRTISGKPMIEVLLNRLSQSKHIDQIVLATSDDIRNDKLEEHVNNLGYDVYRGSERDVLDRYYHAAKKYRPDGVVRITGDCPLIDSSVVDSIIEAFKIENVDYVSNTNPPTYPDGLDVEVFSFSSLEVSWSQTNNFFDREHVTPYIRNSGKFRIHNITNKEDHSNERWTVDGAEDFEVITYIFDHFEGCTDFSWLDVIKLRETKPELFLANQHLIRNEGSIMGTGQKLWGRAKKIIPGGNMLLSKRAEMFLPGQWPSYFSKSKGCKVWDLDGNEYIDMSIMGIGTNTLGYGHPEVDEAVKKTIEAGNMSTFNCPEEVYLAEKLIELHPWADMVRLARAGGEINSISIRIARATTGKDKIAICGYHGWHDWYLSTNLSSGENLDSHLLPGLEPSGVPQGLAGTTLPFNYNKIEELEAIITSNHNQIAAIKMEVSRNAGPEDDFLQKVRKIATDNNIVLIFDECTSGFRETFGGLHKKYNVEPDIAIFAKALGNGYAISACIGRQEVMQAAQKTFISSTFWTERIGPTAALKTLEVMEREKSWETITNTGQCISNKWIKLAKSHDLKINTWGLSSLSGFSFESNDVLAYKTFITQEMLKKGYLAANSVYVCIDHTPDIIEGYFNALTPIFKQIKKCEEGGNIYSLLDGEICHSGFKRLN